MAEYTYFIVTPGCDYGSYVSYPEGEKGIYIKLGDQNLAKKPGHTGLRD